MFELDVMNIMILLGFMVFGVNVIVEVTKDLWPFNKIRTNYYVTILSISLSAISYFVYIDLNNSKIVWYYLLGAIFCGFMVAYLAMFGWDKLIKLWRDSQRKE